MDHRTNLTNAATNTPDPAQSPPRLIGVHMESETRVPFSVVDEAIHLLDVGTAPWSIQLEVRVKGRLDEARLRAAITESLRRHPMARVRKLPSRLRAPLDNWAIMPDARIDPLRVVDCPDDDALVATRVELQGISVPLTESPPLRVVLARHPDGDMVMLNVNHAAMDGFGALRVLQSIARVYAGTPDPMPALDFEQSRTLTDELTAGRLSIRLRRQLALATRLRDLLAPPARVVGHGAVDEAGYGFVHWRLSESETGSLVEAAAVSAGAQSAAGRPTVNDVLLAALHLAIADWNAQHGVAGRRIGVLVPANLRPQEWRQEIVGNYSLPARISTTERTRQTPGATLGAIAAQTRRKKKVGMGTAFVQLLGQSRLLPLWAKRLVVLALPLTGNRLVDTAMLSNLGRVDNLPSFGGGPGAGTVEELWFSPPARMPLGLTIGAATVTGRLHLVLRYRFRMFDQDAAARFAALFAGKLQTFSRSEGQETIPSDDHSRLAMVRP